MARVGGAHHGVDPAPEHDPTGGGAQRCRERDLDTDDVRTGPLAGLEARLELLEVVVVGLRVVGGAEQLLRLEQAPTRTAS